MAASLPSQRFGVVLILKGWNQGSRAVFQACRAEVSLVCILRDPMSAGLVQVVGVGQGPWSGHTQSS